MSHVYCPECGFQNPEAANYCARCGSMLVKEQVGDATQTFTPEEIEEARARREVGLEARRSSSARAAAARARRSGRPASGR